MSRPTFGAALHDFTAEFGRVEAPEGLRPDGFIDPSEDEIQVARDAVDDLKWKHITGSAKGGAS